MTNFMIQMDFGSTLQTEKTHTKLVLNDFVQIQNEKELQFFLRLGMKYHCMNLAQLH